MTAGKTTWICDRAPSAVSAVEYGSPNLIEFGEVAALVKTTVTSIGASCWDPAGVPLEFLPAGMRIVMQSL
jgi:hypothetical protein